MATKSLTIKRNINKSKAINDRIQKKSRSHILKEAHAFLLSSFLTLVSLSSQLTNNMGFPHPYVLIFLLSVKQEFVWEVRVEPYQTTAKKRGILS